MILQNHLELFLQSLETGFLKLSGENIFFAQENALKTIFLFLVTHILYQQQLDMNALTF